MRLKEKGSIDANAEFNYGRPWGNADFLGKKRQIAAFVERLSIDTEVLLEDGRRLRYSAGTKYLDIHLDSRPVDIYDGEEDAVIRTMFRASEDLTHLLAALQTRKKLQNIKFISGTTNPRLARLATEKLGFCRVSRDEAPLIDLITDKGTETLFVEPHVLQNHHQVMSKRLERLKRRLYH